MFPSKESSDDNDMLFRDSRSQQQIVCMNSGDVLKNKVRYNVKISTKWPKLSSRLGKVHVVRKLKDMHNGLKVGFLYCHCIAFEANKNCVRY